MNEMLFQFVLKNAIVVVLYTNTMWTRSKMIFFLYLSMAGELGTFSIHIHIYGKEKGEKVSLIEKEKGAKKSLSLSLSLSLSIYIYIYIYVFCNIITIKKQFSIIIYF